MKQYKRKTPIELQAELKEIEDMIDRVLDAKPKQNWWFLSEEFNSMLRRRNIIK